MEDLDNRTYDLLFAVRRSVRYHERRRRFFEIWNSITVGTAAVGGSSAVATILSTPTWEWLPIAFAGAVSALGVIDLVVSTARRAGQHGDLSRQFIALEQKFAHGRNLKDREHEELVRERLRIEASEPTILRLLDLMCHFEVLVSLGDKSQHPKIPWLRGKLAQWFSQTDYAQTLRPIQEG